MGTENVQEKFNEYLEKCVKDPSLVVTLRGDLDEENECMTLKSFLEEVEKIKKQNAENEEVNARLKNIAEKGTDPQSKTSDGIYGAILFKEIEGLIEKLKGYFPGNRCHEVYMEQKYMEVIGILTTIIGFKNSLWKEKKDVK